jgi:transglutaminase-like putative cysteine protease
MAYRQLDDRDRVGDTMTWRIATRHTSTYRYSEPVVASFNEARVTPSASHGQIVVEANVSVHPATSLYTYRDYFSTVVTAFDIPEPHSELIVTGSSTVETAPPIVPDGSFEWSDLADPGIRDRFSEYLAPTRYTTGDSDLAEVAESFGECRTPTEAVDAVGERVRKAMRYEIGSTRVSTSALEAWAQGRGVCQDFAHVGIVLLRDLGIPARYVSGYLHPHADATVGERAEGQGHAWIEYWLGAWYPTDLTHGEPVEHRHVTVARGRDYADVAPFRGLYQGGALAGLDVSVGLIRLN